MKANETDLLLMDLLLITVPKNMDLLLITIPPRKKFAAVAIFVMEVTKGSARMLRFW